MTITNDIRYVGVNDHAVDLFEGQYHGIWSHHFMANRLGNSGNCQTLFLGAPKSLQMVTAAMKLKD